jgi:hypothetical protein
MPIRSHLSHSLTCTLAHGLSTRPQVHLCLCAVLSQRRVAELDLSRAKQSASDQLSRLQRELDVLSQAGTLSQQEMQQMLEHERRRHENIEASLATVQREYESRIHGEIENMRTSAASERARFTKEIERLTADVAFAQVEAEEACLAVQAWKATDLTSQAQLASLVHDHAAQVKALEVKHHHQLQETVLQWSSQVARLEAELQHPQDEIKAKWEMAENRAKEIYRHVL